MGNFTFLSMKSLKRKQMVVSDVVSEVVTFNVYMLMTEMTIVSLLEKHLNDKKTQPTSLINKPCGIDTKTMTCATTIRCL